MTNIYKVLRETWQFSNLIKQEYNIVNELMRLPEGLLSLKLQWVDKSLSSLEGQQNTLQNTWLKNVAGEDYLKRDFPEWRIKLCFRIQKIVFYVLRITSKLISFKNTKKDLDDLCENKAKYLSAFQCFQYNQYFSIGKFGNVPIEARFSGVHRGELTIFDSTLSCNLEKNGDHFTSILQCDIKFAEKRLADVVPITLAIMRNNQRISTLKLSCLEYGNALVKGPQQEEYLTQWGFQKIPNTSGNKSQWFFSREALKTLNSRLLGSVNTITFNGELPPGFSS